MTQEGLEIIYRKDLTPLYPARVDACLTNIPSTDTFNAPEETIKSPEQLIAERVESVADAIRTIDTSLRRIAYNGAVLTDVYKKSPGSVQALPEALQRQVMEIIRRMAQE